MKRGAWGKSAARGTGEYKYTHTRKAIVDMIRAVLKNTTPTRLSNNHRDKEIIKGALAQLIHMEGKPLRLGNDLDSSELEVITDFYQEHKAAILVRVGALQDDARWERVGPKTYQSVNRTPLRKRGSK